MSPAPSDIPLRRVTLNLYNLDCQQMAEIYGRGWTEVVRNLVRKHVQDHRKELAKWQAPQN